DDGSRCSSCSRSRPPSRAWCRCGGRACARSHPPRSTPGGSRPPGPRWQRSASPSRCQSRATGASSSASRGPTSTATAATPATTCSRPGSPMSGSTPRAPAWWSPARCATPTPGTSSSSCAAPTPARRCRSTTWSRSPTRGARAPRRGHRTWRWPSPTTPPTSSRPAPPPTRTRAPTTPRAGCRPTPATTAPTRCSRCRSRRPTTSGSRARSTPRCARRSPGAAARVVGRCRARRLASHQSEDQGAARTDERRWVVFALDGTVILSATDLTVALTCEYALLRRLDEVLERAPRLEVVDLVRERAAALGDAHELRVLEGYRERFGDAVVEIEPVTDWTREELVAAHERTVAALAAGAPVVAQASFFDGRLHGRADFLVREGEVDGVPRYAVVDAKLARRARATAILQLAVYADQVERAGIAVAPTTHLHLGND